MLEAPRPHPSVRLAHVRCVEGGVDHVAAHLWHAGQKRVCLAGARAGFDDGVAAPGADEAQDGILLRREGHLKKTSRKRRPLVTRNPTVSSVSS